jgi:hypothetical protein
LILLHSVFAWCAGCSVTEAAEHACSKMGIPESCCYRTAHKTAVVYKK